jgi:hypothetical protein
MALRGFIDKMTAEECLGWVVDDEDPNSHIEVEVWTPEGGVATGVACNFRQDLLTAGYGDGCHAFSLSFANFAYGGEVATARYRVFARGPSGRKKELRHTNSSVAVSQLKAGEGQLLVPDAPIFILGAARSGTSALYTALVSASVAEGFGEGHFFPLLKSMESSVQEYYRQHQSSILNGASTSVITAALVFSSFCDGLRPLMRGIFRGRRWIDKTPSVEMLKVAPILAELWPKAKFIFMKRRGIENILSRQRKFPDTVFEELCSDWSSAMEVWASVRQGLLTRSFELDQAEMHEDPNGTAQRLGPFLDLTQVQVAQVASYLSNPQVEKTAPFTQAPINLDETGWTVHERNTFNKSCRDAMKLYGYDYF